MARVAIRLLGGFDATADGEPVAAGAWRLKKARELVKLLALATDHRLHREQAMDVLWRDRGPAAAANNLNQAVHVARRALGQDAIEVRDGLIRLEAEVDVEGFEQAAAEARRAGTQSAYRAALSLYGGELLPENRYDDWTEERRAALAELHALIEGELARFGFTGALRDLPLETSSFIGRERELGELRALLGRTRLLTLTGTGGAGKTRLALELARAVASSYADGVAYVELAAVDAPGQVGAAVAAALDVRPLPGGDVEDAIAEFLAPRSLLVVLDNCEHVLGACASLADRLLRVAGDLRIVATSREPLRLPAEIVFRVPSLAIPDPDAPLEAAELLGFEAVRLFVERAAAVAPGFGLDEENAPDVARICFRLDGLPLAIELAAGRMGALGPASIAERLDDRFRLLRAGRQTAPTRQQTLAATLAWSHELLSPEERVLLRRLAVFAGTFDLAAVETVCSGAGVDRADAADVLARLVEKSLVSADEHPRERRYHLLETVRLYARERLDEAAERAAFADRHARWAIELAEREGWSPLLDRDAPNLRLALETLTARDPQAALRLCVALRPFWLRRIDLDEGRRRFQHALAAVPERTALRVRALVASASVNLRAGMVAAVGEGLLQESLAVAEEIGDAREQWRALHFLGGSSLAYDTPARAFEPCGRALEIARREGFEAEATLTVYTLGIVHWKLGDLAEARSLVSESVETLRSLGDSGGLIPTPFSIAESRQAGPFGPTLVFEDTLQPFVEVSCPAAACYARINLAGILRDQGDPERAAALLDESAAHFVRTGDERGEADTAIRRAFLELAGGAHARARKSLERSLELRRTIGDRRGTGMALAGLGLVETAAGELDRAEQRLGEAHALFRRAGDRWGLIAALWNAADLAVARGGIEAAEEALEEALAVVSRTGRELWVAHTLLRLGDAALLAGGAAAGRERYAEALARFDALGDASGKDDASTRLARLARARKTGAKQTQRAGR